MRRIIQSIADWCGRLKKSSRFHSLLLFLLFVVIAAFFWLVMALNDSVQDTVKVRIRIDNKPDSVTFISIVPKDLHVEVRDKGTSLFRAAGVHEPVVSLNFRELASDGQFICSRTDMMSALKSAFGPSASIISSSIDSLRLVYTDRPGKSVPVQISVQASPKAGFVVYGAATATPQRVMVYGPRQILDTVSRIFTKRYVERDLSDPVSFNAELVTIPGARVIPSSVSVKVNVEPLVVKETMVSVTAENVPAGENLLLFPSKVQVSYYVPMSRFSDTDLDPKIIVDYQDITHHMGRRLPVHIEMDHNPNIVNPVLRTDSVEYTLLR